jgi:hypothetical protein
MSLLTPAVEILPSLMRAAKVPLFGGQVDRGGLMTDRPTSP